MIDTVLAVSAALGACVGLILGLTGAGGAIMAVPLLVFGLHLQVSQAAPIALLAVGLSAALGAVLGLRKGQVRYRAAGFMAVTGILVSPLGLWAARRLPNAPLAIIFAGVLGMVAWRMWNQGNKPAAQAAPRTPPCQLNASTGRLRWTAPCARALTGAGLIAGFLSGLLGVGGGFVIVPALRRATDLSMQAIVGTSLAVIALVSASGVVAAAAGGHLDWRIAAPFTAAAVLGMLGGRKVADRFPPRRLQQSFALFAGLVAVAMLMKGVLALLAAA
ncbi:sulfite exporter TauE/SafE family protein [Achromobacter sp. K91]|uniref:sulfite exporter TauE/SafE family protein n=1 Tax=Achromobacter TaxID=222 RepID=UPI000E66D1CA|nr:MULTISPECIES: sulfite exporter TauE/SafE family protein [Achromobacter]MBD9475524.1 sulfite exporter TauE/SafE family protein [Achromobacter sp. ACM01]MDQ1759372.1 sulfite exporter TauE/SafE family protein [Achromobacter aegrifaciens]RIJ03435.1 sulfite exporter TauE/SafE family protein [Achromobacter sp. K91]